MRAFYENKNYDFYCRDTDFSKKTLGFTSHLHYHIELALVKSGKTFVTIDTETYSVEAGDIIIVFPNQVHRFETIEREKYILMITSPDIISEFMPQFTCALPSSNLIKGGAGDPELMLLASKISALYRSDEPYKNETIRGYLLAFFGRLLGKMELTELQSKESSVLGMILNYCIRNSSHAITLDTLERELHISKYYISHLMNDKLHMALTTTSTP